MKKYIKGSSGWYDRMEIKEIGITFPSDIIRAMIITRLQTHQMQAKSRGDFLTFIHPPTPQEVPFIYL